MSTEKVEAEEETAEEVEKEEEGGILVAAVAAAWTRRAPLGLSSLLPPPLPPPQQQPEFLALISGLASSPSEARTMSDEEEDKWRRHRDGQPISNVDAADTDATGGIAHSYPPSEGRGLSRRRRSSRDAATLALLLIDEPLQPRRGGA